MPFVHSQQQKNCLLFQNILKRTKEGTKEEQAASKSLASVSKVNPSHLDYVPPITNPYNSTHESFTCLWKIDIILCPTDGFPIK